MERVARDIADEGGRAELAQVDALDEHAVGAHADALAAHAGGIDIALDAVGRLHDQGTPFAELNLADVQNPMIEYTRTSFLTARAVARHMSVRRSGVILTLSTPGSELSGRGFLGHGMT